MSGASTSEPLPMFLLLGTIHSSVRAYSLSVILSKNPLVIPERYVIIAI